MTAEPILPHMVELDGGEFVMGRENGRDDERPAHTVRVSRFRAAIAPVTNSEYAAFVEATGHEAPPFLDQERFAGPELPAVGVSWHDAMAYCAWIARASGVAFRLPTEAEREFAAAGGLAFSDWPWTGEPPNRAIVDGANGPHAPAEECANGYGLRCIAENVHEWCSDWYSPTYYAESPSDNPAGPPAGTRRASRGGAWRHKDKYTRINARSSIPPEFRYSDYGFRLYS